MTPTHPVLDLLKSLYDAHNLIQGAFQALLQRYFQFLKSGPRGRFKSTRWLRMRFERDRERRIRSISWTKRIRATKTVNGREQALTSRMVGEYSRDWVYKIAKDWTRADVYNGFDSERRVLNSLSTQILDNRRRIRLSFTNRWSARSSVEDRCRAERLIAPYAPNLKAREIPALAGALAYQRAVDESAVELGRAVTDWRQTFERSLTVHFEPALRSNDDGSLRLYWGFPQRVGTPEGMRTFTDYIPGGPTDLLMRTWRIPVRTRKEVAASVKRIRTLERTYRDLVDQVGRHRKRVHELLSRVARLDHPRGSGGLLADSRTQPAAGVGTPPKEAM